MELKIKRKQIRHEGCKGGLEILIPGVLGDPTYAGKGNMQCPIFIEEYNGKIQIHIWDGKQDPQTIVLTNTKEVS